MMAERRIYICNIESKGCFGSGNIDNVIFGRWFGSRRQGGLEHAVGYPFVAALIAAVPAVFGQVDNATNADVVGQVIKIIGYIKG
jgi:hypothetical protein